MKNIKTLKIKIFFDGAKKKTIFEMYKKNLIRGFTTNPSIMKKDGVRNFKGFCKEILSVVKKKPISIEVFSDNFNEMERQALEINSWADNIYIKIPITNTKNKPSYDLIKSLSKQNVKLNLTAVMTIERVNQITKILKKSTRNFISIFAGRIADTGRDPIPVMKEAIEILKYLPNTELIWASPRELLNVFQADEIGCHIITITEDILKKFTLIGYDLNQFSLDTVKMFHSDAIKSGFKL
jgi:transaldolase